MGFQKELAFRVTAMIIVTYLYRASGGCQSNGHILNSVFLVEPSNTFVKKGQDAAFTCSAYVNTESYDYIEWQIDPDVYGTFVSEQHSIHNKIPVLISSVKVQNVGETSQFIRCIFHTRPNKTEGETCYVSRSARNTVQYFPSKSECRPEEPGSLHEGDLLKISCRVLRCVPPVDMSWQLEGNVSTLLPKPILYDDGLTRLLSLHLQVTKDLHMKNITCLVTNHNTFPDQKVACTIGPVLVLTPPDATAYPRQGVLFQERSYIRMSCTAKGFPNIHSFTWSCIPYGVVHGCNTSSSSWNASLISRQPTDNITSSVNISCFASNSVGTSSSTSQFKIIPSSIRSVVNTDEVRVVDGIESDTVDIHAMTLNVSHILYTIYITSLESTPEIKTVECFSENYTLKESITILSSDLNYEFDLLLPLSMMNIGETVKCETTPRSRKSIFFELSSNFSFSKERTMTENVSTMATTPSLIHQPKETVQFNKDFTSFTPKYTTNDTYFIIDSPFDAISSPKPNKSTTTYSTWKVIVIALSGIISMMLIIVAMVICVSTLVLRSFQRHDDNIKQFELQDTSNVSETSSIVRPKDSCQDDSNSTSDPSYEVPMSPTNKTGAIDPGHEYDSKLFDSTSTSSYRSGESVYSFRSNSSYSDNDTIKNKRQISSRFSI